MIDEIELIRKIDFFQALEDRILKRVAEVCIPKNYSKGDYLIRQGEIGLGLFLVVRGRLQVEVEKDGRGTVVAELKDEDFVGELAVIDNKPRSANVICVEETRCLVLTRDSFLKILDKYPQIAIQMAKSLSERLRSMDEFVSGKPIHREAPGEIASAVVDGAGHTSAPTSPSPEPSEPSGKAGGPQNGSGLSSKDRIRDFMVDTFSHFYTVKAMTRFSVAVVGCPVEVKVQGSRSDFFEARVGEVKLVVFPDSKKRCISLDAFDHGSFSITLLQPPKVGDSEACHRQSFCGQVNLSDRLELRVPARGGGTPHLKRTRKGKLNSN